MLKCWLLRERVHFFRFFYITLVFVYINFNRISSNLLPHLSQTIHIILVFWRIFINFFHCITLRLEKYNTCKNCNISHKLLRPSQFLEKFMKILETCVKKLSQILANNIDNGVRGIGLRIYVRYCGSKIVPSTDWNRKIICMFTCLWI